MQERLGLLDTRFVFQFLSLLPNHQMLLLLYSIFFHSITLQEIAHLFLDPVFSPFPSIIPLEFIQIWWKKLKFDKKSNFLDRLAERNGSVLFLFPDF